ncbi:hypothetical protein C1645_832695 [Glomus cerebriforme]|uniref:Uncharacterized protein n=1 Tax=Glomus cerebriforme TaxID=658196 RepID=A0A397SF24_9GLOM|nr:hypothetical protein C1645_832695 [Glomus cerebriforme]
MELCHLFLSIEHNQQTETHLQAVYTSRLLNPFTENLLKYDNINNNTVEIIDFTNLKIENKNEDVKK